MLIFYNNYYITLILSILFFRYQALENGARSDDIASLSLVHNDESLRNIIKRDTKIDYNAEVKENKYQRKILAVNNRNNQKKVVKKKASKKDSNKRKPKKDSTEEIIHEKFIHEKFALIELCNEIRRKHHSPELKFSYKLSEEAQKLAVKLLKTKKWKYYKNSKYGVITYFTPNMEIEYTPINYWTKGETNINYKNLEKTIPPDYAQIVWFSSKQIGCGITDKGPKKGSLTVCLFYPKGNIKNKYSKNIYKPIK
uniref:SCP domain-containing protein n=1 Tax=Strongyloides papillosus TaxID=174720 RepID=A0A0N5BMY5_STREA